MNAPGWLKRGSGGALEAQPVTPVSPASLGIEAPVTRRNVGALGVGTTDTESDYSVSEIRAKLDEWRETINRLSDAGVATSQCLSLKQIIDLIEEACCVSRIDGQKVINDLREEAWGLVDKIVDSIPGMLTGRPLAHAVRDTMPVALPRAAPAIVASEVEATVACEGEASLFDAPGGEPASATPCAPAASPVKAPRNLGALS